MRSMSQTEKNLQGEHPRLGDQLAKSTGGKGAWKEGVKGTWWEVGSGGGQGPVVRGHVGCAVVFGPS